ncbi:uncharacterized protein LOC135625770 [Musa acuminata AAA Group]|uniref:uncharacterized protein LOC135625770 n=1 Tax=Musa acuminata AAA Group TaxID=214697 RepID=UPI0031DE47B7
MQRSPSYQPLQTQGRQMEVVAVPMAPANVNPFSSYVTAPPSPQHPLDYCGYYCYTSAPTSPSRAAVVYPAEASDFAFCFGGRSEGEKPTPALATADELFEEGMIRPLMLPPRRLEERERERALLPTFSAASSKAGRGSKPLSPRRGGEEEDGLRKSPSSSSASVKSGGSKKWKLKDLFRSASEGRATGRGSKDPLRSYTVLLPPSKRIDDSGSVGGGGAADPHEMYYSPNRAASEELKRKKKQTPLPYQHHGLFGCLRFNPAIHSIQKGFGGSSSSHK